MKRIFSLMFSFCLVLLAVFFAGCEPVKEQEDNSVREVKILGLGDSISAGYAPRDTELYNYYYSYLYDDAPINAKCFTNSLALKLSNDSVSCNAKSYAESGDKSSDLIDKLNNSQSYPDLLFEIKNADIITLCIGANNVLLPALDNLSRYLTGEIGDDEIEQILNVGFENFRNDYSNFIMPVLSRSNGIIMVMTIYDPYKYFDLNEVQMPDIMKFILSGYFKKFNGYKAKVINYLNKINAYIKAQKYDRVYVVDINSEFDKLSESDYKTYLNVNSDELVVSSVVDLMSLNTNVFMDPHPTIQGQEFIADVYLNVFNENVKGFYD